MAVTFEEIKKIPVPPQLNNADILKALTDDFTIWETNGFKDIYNSQTYTEFKNVDQLREYLKKIGVQESNLTNKQLGILIQNWYESFSKVPEYTEPTVTEMPASTTVEGKLEELQEAQVAEQTRRAQSAKSDQEIRDAIAKKIELVEQEKAKNKKLQKDLEGKNVYYKQERVDKKPLSENDKKIIETLKQEFQKDPEKFKEDLEAIIKERVAKNIPEGVSPEDVNTAIHKTAADITQNFTGDINHSPAIQNSFYSSFSKNYDVSKTVIGNTDLTKKTNDIASLLTDSRTPVYLLSEQIAKSAFGEGVASEMFPTYRTQISSSQQEGFDHIFSLEQLAVKQGEILDNQTSILQSISDIQEFTPQSVQIVINRKINDFVKTSVSKIPVLQGAYESKIVQATLSLSGFGEPINWVATNGIGKAAQFFGLEGTFGWAGEITGINFGIGRAATGALSTAVTETATATAAEAAATAVGTAATEAAATAAGTAAGAEAGAATGAAVGQAAIPIPGVGAIIGFIGGLVGGKLLGKLSSWLKQQWTKNKDKIAPIGIGLLAGGIFFRNPFLLVTGGSLTAIGVGAGGLASIGAGFLGVWAGIRFLFRNLIGPAVVAPIAITMLVLPVLVAFIMFVINSGAYIVPPSPFFQGGKFSSPYVDITKTPNPSGPFSNSEFPKTITYTISIKPKKGPLNNVKLGYDCKVISKSESSCPEITINEDNYKDVFSSTIDSISPTGISFTYTSTYDNQYQDSAIIDSIILNASTQEEPNVNSEVSASVTFGTPPISCPVPGAKVASPQYNYSLNQSNNTGHGSQAYWNAMGQKPSAYAIPQGSGCHSVNDCSYYGYAYDVFPTGTKEVFTPTVEGKDVTWACSYGFSNKNAGHTYICNGSGYTLVLTHMANGAKTGIVNSGEKIGTLYNQGGNTHLHIEFSINGRWQKPENYFCQ